MTRSPIRQPSRRRIDLAVVGLVAILALVGLVSTGARSAAVVDQDRSIAEAGTAPGFGRYTGPLSPFVP